MTYLKISDADCIEFTDRQFSGIKLNIDQKTITLNNNNLSVDLTVRLLVYLRIKLQYATMSDEESFTCQQACKCILHILETDRLKAMQATYLLAATQQMRTTINSLRLLIVLVSGLLVYKIMYGL